MPPDRQFNVFAVPDLWRASIFAITDDETSTLFPDLHHDVLTITLDNPYAPKINLVDNFKLPSIDAFHYGPLNSPEPSAASVISTEPEQDDASEEADGDIWDTVADPLPIIKRPKYLSWRGFSCAIATDNHSPYLSEWGSSAFDAVLRKSKIEGHSRKPCSIIQSGVLLRALYDLGLGRSSLLYNCGDEKMNLRTNIDHFTASGLSITSLQSLEVRVKGCGMAIKYLRDFSDRTYVLPTFPVKVAFANAVSTVLATIEAHFSSQRAKTRSWIQLQYVFSKAEQLLDHLVNIVRTIKKTKCDEDLVSILFNACQHIEHDASWLLFIMQEILSRVSHPFLNRLNTWIGLYHDQSTQLNFQDPRLSFIQIVTDPVKSSSQTPTYLFNPEKLPVFISRDQGQRIYDIGSSLRLLHYHQRDNANVLCSTSPEHALKWAFQWTNVESIVRKAQNYEKSLASAVRGSSTKLSIVGSSTSSNQQSVPVWLENANDDALLKSTELLNQFPIDTSSLPDELSEIVRAALEKQNSYGQEQLEMVPPLSLIPQLSFDPHLNAQFRLVKSACLRLMFRSHNLRHHLELQKAFHLMGDGVFISQISAALFDSSAHGTERELGVMRSGTGMGLKLNERQSWPPASSELRLALMGILNNCYASSSYLRSNNRTRQAGSSELPGSMSFAIRNLPESEIERITNPSSLYALDFLRLQYNPSSPIDEVITSTAIEKYDLIFKHLLRLVRLLFSVSRLPRIQTSALMQRFIFQARHFVNSCASYFFETVIGLNWAEFESHLNRIEKAMKDEDEEQPEMMRDLGGIHELRRSHEACLDKILYGLFLRQRQSKVSALLEEIFTMVLKLESLCRISSPTHTDIQELYSDFGSRVKLFEDVCQGLSGKKISGFPSNTEDTIGRLLMTLNFNGFYNIKMTLP